MSEFNAECGQQKCARTSKRHRVLSYLEAYVASLDLHLHIHADQSVVLTRIDALEGTMTQAFDTTGAALDALQAEATTLAADEAADRAAFDTLATAVRAFLAALPAPGEVLTAEHSAQAQAILDTLTSAAASEVGQAADEAALAAEVPPGA